MTRRFFINLRLRSARFYIEPVTIPCRIRHMLYVLRNLTCGKTVIRNGRCGGGTMQLTFSAFEPQAPEKRMLKTRR